MTVTAMPSVPLQTDDPVIYVPKYDAHVAALPQLINETNDFSENIDLKSELTNSSKKLSEYGYRESKAYANHRGEWSNLSGFLISESGVRHNELDWFLINDLVDVTTSEPGLTLDWSVILNESSINLSGLDNPLLDSFNKNKIGDSVSIFRDTLATYIDIYNKIIYTASASTTNNTLYSEDISNAVWIINKVSKLSNTDTAPDGTLTADRIKEQATVGTHKISQSAIGADPVTVCSIFVNPVSRFRFTLTSGGSAATFNLQDKTSSVSGGTTIINDVGNGWFRCSLSITNAPASASVTIAILDDSGANNYMGDSGKYLLVWGVQQESAFKIPNGYVVTTGSAVTGISNFAVDLKRPEVKGFLFEGEGENLSDYSEEVDNASWVKGSLVTVTPNDTEAPDGYIIADRVVSTGVVALNVNDLKKSIVIAPTDPNGRTFTASVWLKATSQIRIIIRLGNSSDTDNETKNITVTTEWQRFNITRTYTEASSGVTLRIGLQSTAYDIHVWGLQIEEGLMTSYIPTIATSELRGDDIVTIPVSNNFPLQPYSLSMSFIPYQLNTADDRLFDLTNGVNASLNTSGILTVDSGDRSLSSTNEISVDNEYHMTMTVDSSSTKLYLNGALESVSTSSESVNVDGTGDITIGNRAANDRPFFGHINNLQLHDFSLNAAQSRFLTGV